MLVFGRELFGEPRSATGVSLVAGRRIDDVDDLPPHALEAHLFPDAQGAVCFVAGLRIRPGTDRVSVTHDTGSVETNRIVVVALLDEPRGVARVPEGALRTIEHARTTIDRDAVRAAAAARLAAHAEEARRHDGRTAALAAALEARGYGTSRSGGPWVALTEGDAAEGDESGRWVVDVPEDGGMTVRQGARGVLRSAGRHGEVVRAAMAGAGVTVSADGTASVSGLRDAEGVARAASRISTARACGEAALEAARREEARSGMRMNLVRARIVEHAAEGWEPAAAARFPDGEVEVLARAGWLRREGSSVTATDPALCALAAFRAATRGRVRAHRARAAGTGGAGASAGAM